MPQESLALYTVTIFVISTTGQGDLPADTRTFWRKLLLKALPNNFLEGVDFALFGLGDSSYPKYDKRQHETKQNSPLCLYDSLLCRFLLSV